MKLLIEHYSFICQREKQNYKKKCLHLGKAFFVHVIHHDNLIVKCSTGPPRAEISKKKNEQSADKMITGKQKHMKFTTAPLKGIHISQTLLGL